MANIDSPFTISQQLIDDANRQDPCSAVNPEDGTELPAELLYSRRMVERLASFAPDASEALQLAVRAQHIQRWQIPRHEYPMKRAGYLQWRRELGLFHARTCGQLLQQAGYDITFSDRVGELLMKKNRQPDSEAQTLEDVACLVFLEHYLVDFAPKHDTEKLANIIRKTWRKMSPKAQQVAMTISLPDPMIQFIESALAPAS